MSDFDFDLVGQALNERFGDGTAVSAKDIPDTQFIKTGINNVDELIGGIPIGRITEIFGRPSSGKTSIVYQIIANYGDKTAFFDLENTYDGKFARSFGVDETKVKIMRPVNGEAAMQMIKILMNEGCKLIIVDSISSLIPKSQTDSDDITKKEIASLARLMTLTLPALVATANKTSSTIIFVNQVRAKYGAAVWGDNIERPGGYAVKHYTSLALKIAKIEFIYVTTDRTRKYGITSRIRVDKSKVCLPYGECIVDLIFGKGFMDAGEGIKYVKTLRKEERKASKK